MTAVGCWVALVLAAGPPPRPAPTPRAGAPAEHATDTPTAGAPGPVLTPRAAEQLRPVVDAVTAGALGPDIRLESVQIRSRAVTFDLRRAAAPATPLPVRLGPPSGPPGAWRAPWFSVHGPPPLAAGLQRLLVHHVTTSPWEAPSMTAPSVPSRPVWRGRGPGGSAAAAVLALLLLCGVLAVGGAAARR